MGFGAQGDEYSKLSLTSKVFEEKTAREKLYQHDGTPENGGHAWRSDVYDYFVSKCPVSGPWLLWAEERGAAEITAADITYAKMNDQVMTDEVNPFVVSHLVWGLLQHCLTGAARQTFKTTARQDGFNVWRKLILDINSRTDCVRHMLRN